MGARCRPYRCPIQGRHRARSTAVLKMLGDPIEGAVLRRAAAVIVLTPQAAAHLAADGVPPRGIHLVPFGFLSGVGTSTSESVRMGKHEAGPAGAGQSQAPRSRPRLPPLHCRFPMRC
jgi:hypothetical protein